MDILVNGQKRTSNAVTLRDLWRCETEHLDLPSPRGYAIAINGAVVRQADWGERRILAGDRIEIIRAMPGG